MKAKRKSKQTRQVSQYDKIVKENIEAVLPTLFEKVLDLHIVETEEIPDDLQLTIERKPDFLKKVRDTFAQSYILQVEFQVLEDEDMIHRMLEYYALLYRKHKLPIKQFVIFLGKGEGNMKTELQHTQLTFSYSLIKIIGVDYEYFTSSDVPEEILFGILSDFKDKTPEQVIEEIVIKLYETVEGQLSFQKYYQQLRVLGNLRNLVPSIQFIMEKVSTFYTLESDYVYIKGMEKGMEKGEKKMSEWQRTCVVELLHLNLLSVKQIAKISQTKMTYVKKIQKELEQL